MVNIGENPVRGAIVSEDGLKVRIVVDALRAGYIHAVVPEGVLSQNENRLPIGTRERMEKRLKEILNLKYDAFDITN
jgi:hypothetical protein